MNESGIFATVSIQVLEASSAWPLPEIVTCVVVCFVNASSYHAALLEPHSPFPEKSHCGRFTGYAHLAWQLLTLGNRVYWASLASVCEPIV